MFKIIISKTADKSIKKAPIEIRESFEAWKNVIQLQGIAGLKEIKGYRDHALKGEWEGARSSSLNSQWRVIYFIKDKEIAIFVLDVTAHDYRRRL